MPHLLWHMIPNHSLLLTLTHSSPSHFLSAYPLPPPQTSPKTNKPLPSHYRRCPRHPLPIASIPLISANAVSHTTPSLPNPSGITPSTAASGSSSERGGSSAEAIWRCAYGTKGAGYAEMTAKGASSFCQGGEEGLVQDGVACGQVSLERECWVDCRGWREPGEWEGRGIEAGG